MFEALAMKALSPYLSKITDYLDNLSKEYGVTDSYLMISKKMVDEKPVAFLYIMGMKDGKMTVLEKDGVKAEFPIEKLLQLLSGGKIEQEEDND